MDAISLQAAAIRGLTNRDSFERRLVSSEELRQIIEEGFAEDAEDVEIADRLYTILSIIEPDSALSDILLDVYSNIVVGLFDTDENVLYVLAEGDEFTASNELTVAHEVAHGLQQQHFNIKDIGDAYEDNSDRQSAIRALIEGDATLVELIYRLRVFDDRQRQLHMEESQAADLSAFRAAPPFIQRTVAFPYFEGANFAISMYQLTGDFSIDRREPTIYCPNRPSRYCIQSFLARTRRSRLHCPILYLRSVTAGPRLIATSWESCSWRPFSRECLM